MTHASDPDTLRTAQLAKEVRGLLFIFTPGSHSSTLPVLHSGKLDVARGPALLDEAVGHDEKARNPARFRVRPQENPCLAFLKGLAGLLSHLGFSPPSRTKIRNAVARAASGGPGGVTAVQEHQSAPPGGKGRPRTRCRAPGARRQEACTISGAGKGLSKKDGPGVGEIFGVSLTTAKSAMWPTLRRSK